MNLGLLGLERMGPGEIVLIVLALVLIFGARRIPELARALGKSLSEFKKGQKEGAVSASSGDESEAEPAEAGEDKKDA